MLQCTKNEVSIKDFFSKCDQIRSFLQIWSHLLKKSLMENFNLWNDVGVFSGYYALKVNIPLVVIILIWVKLFKNGLSRICGRQPFKSLK